LKFSDFHRLPEDTPEIDNNLKKERSSQELNCPKKDFQKLFLPEIKRPKFLFVCISFRRYWSGTGKRNN
jgi:hypothetical protein